MTREPFYLKYEACPQPPPKPRPAMTPSPLVTPYGWWGLMGGVDANGGD